MIEIKDLKKYAEKLMFKMNEEEYITLQQEFEVIIKQMDLIAEFDGIENVEPMTFPYDYVIEELRDDKKVRVVENKIILNNAAVTDGREVLVPKVVE